MIVEELKTEKVDWRWKDTLTKITSLAKTCNLVVTNIWEEPHYMLWVKIHYTVLGTRQGIASLQRKLK